MWHLFDLSRECQKFRMSCIFPEPRKCDIYLTFPESVKNFVCRVYFLSLGMWHLFDFSRECQKFHMFYNKVHVAFPLRIWNYTCYVTLLTLGNVIYFQVCKFSNSRTCGISLTFLFTIRNFTCRVHFHFKEMWHLLDISFKAQTNN